MTWNELADAIANMPEDRREEQVIFSDECVEDGPRDKADTNVGTTYIIDVISYVDKLSVLDDAQCDDYDNIYILTP